MHYPIVIFGNKETTKYMIEYIHQHVQRIDLIVTVGEENKSAISGYSDLQSLSKKYGIPLYIVSSYSLKDPKDLEFFTRNSFGLGISVGWQRIIPSKILAQFKHGVFGFHGSAGHLPFGAGRSPLNWSLIKGHTRFLNHCFQYNDKPDEGKIHSIEIFEINEHDTIQTIQYKVLLVGKKQIKELMEDFKNNQIRLFSQSKNKPTWYAKRTSEDGKISLASTTKEIYNLIRGVTHPFPGAFLLTDDNMKFIIWEAYPFDQLIDTFDFQVGEVIETFGDEIVIKTIDGTILIKNYTFEGEIRKGDIFH